MKSVLTMMMGMLCCAASAQAGELPKTLFEMAGAKQEAVKREAREGFHQRDVGFGGGVFFIGGWG